MWFSPTFSPQFPPGFSHKIVIPNVFSPKSTPNIYPDFFAPRFSPIAFRLLPPNFPLVFPPKKFSILIINFYPLLFSLKFSPIVLRIVPQYICPQVFSQICPQDSFSDFCPQIVLHIFPQKFVSQTFYPYLYP